MDIVTYIFLAIGLTIMLVGLARGYDKELGNSIIIMITIAALGFFAASYQEELASLATSILAIQDTNLFLFLVYTLGFIAIVFSTYNGITFNYGGKPVTGLLGSLISLGVGLFNGYLIAGTLWHYANQLGFTLLNLPAPATGGAIDYLPPAVFPDPIYWVMPAAVLLILRVRG